MSELDLQLSLGVTTEHNLLRWSEEELPLTPETAVSPIDGRYARQTASLRNILSEFGLIRGRVTVEALYLRALSYEGVTNRPFTPDEHELLNNIWQKFHPRRCK